jgi:hypothetical protein
MSYITIGAQHYVGHCNVSVVTELSMVQHQEFVRYKLATNDV